MKKNMLWCLLWLSWAANAQNETPMVHRPALSPDGTLIAFSYQGDLWTVPATGGEATRRTIHEGYEAYPVFSPDGQSLAFSSTRNGNADVFTISLTGGNPQRLTWHSANDYVTDWTADGRLLFQTRRAFASVEREWEIYQVAAQGETPTRLLDALGFSAVASPDGRFIALEMGTCRIEREAYRGAANRSIWLFDTQKKTYLPITTSEGQEFRPQWVGNRTLAYLGADSGKYNLYLQPLTDEGALNGTAQQLTKFTDDGIRWFSASNKNGQIVFERQDKIFTLPPTGGTPTHVKFRAVTDYRFDPVEYKTFSNAISYYSLSPNGKHTAFSVHGELFVKLNEKEKNRSVRLTKSPYFDREVEWFNDSLLVFTSDRAGQFDLYLLRSADPKESSIFKSLKHEVVRLTNTPDDESAPVVSPDGKKLAYRRGNGTLLVATLEKDKLVRTVTLQEGWATPSDVAWSPDGQWLAYALSDLYFNEEIYIQAADGSRAPANVSMHPRTDSSPVWSADGSKLGFLSNRNNGDDDVWFVWLRKADWERTKQEWDERSETTDTKKEKDGKKAPVNVVIDFENIHERLVQVTSLPANESDLAISADGEYFFFVNNRNSRLSYGAQMDLHKIKWDGSELKALTSNGTAPYRVQPNAQANALYYLASGGRLNKVSTEGKIEALPFSAKMEIDHIQELDQIFEHAWRTIRDGFYDPNFHGQDWEKLKAKYKPWAMKAGTKTDFRTLFNEMLGQINASHMGLYGSDREETQNERTGLLGLEVKNVRGGVEITRIVPNTPITREESSLQVGEVITAIDGTPLAANENFFARLTNLANEPLLVSVRAGNAEREVIVRPTTSLNRALYDEWVAERKRLTEAYSGGKLGYIHIQGMNWPSFERFERELTASGLGKEGIVIDVRYNGGGWTTDYLMTVLNVKQHAYTIPRNAAKNLEKEHQNFTGYYPFGERLPLSAWTKPSVALCNASSYSNAEIFSHAYKYMKIGTLVGVPTFGAVISTGAQTLIDGSYIRRPGRGWYAIETGENMDFTPAVPNITVENAPNYNALREDAQLKKAVEVLLEQLAAEKK